MAQRLNIASTISAYKNIEPGTIMNHSIVVTISFFLFLLSPANAEDLTIDAAIGGAVGGAIGGALGAELGGREGAIAGAGLGAAAGVAINTADHDAHEGGRYEDRRQEGSYYRSQSDNRKHGKQFCPPGQAKKGRC
ncbi:MAG: hypothetical protein ACI915_002260 [Gammaproteobacteria bacterium]